MATPVTPTGRRLTWQFIIACLAVLVFMAVVLNEWNHRQQQHNVDVNTDRLVTELCADTPDC